MDREAGLVPSPKIDEDFGLNNERHPAIVTHPGHRSVVQIRDYGSSGESVSKACSQSTRQRTAVSVRYTGMVPRTPAPGRISEGATRASRLSQCGVTVPRLTYMPARPNVAR